MILEDVSDRPLYEVTLHVDPWLVQSAVRMHVDAKILRQTIHLRNFTART